MNRITERETQGRTKSYVLNLNADWGQGKSFFLDRFARQLENHQYLVARIDAWADDYAEDPLLPVMTAINHAVGSDSKRAKSAANLKKVGMQLAAAGFKGVATQLAHKIAGEEATKEITQAMGDLAGRTLRSGGEAMGAVASKIYDDVGKAAIERFEKGQQSTKHFKEQLARVLAEGGKERKPPLFVLIDELDRCRPTYAISLLERVKHIFEVNNVVFVIATNSEQLRCSISSVYGAGFDSARYLNRFFDRTYQLFEQRDLAHHIDSVFKELHIDCSKLSFPPQSNFDYLVDGFNHFGFGLRDIAQCLDVLRSILTVWEYPFPIEIDLLFPLLIAQHRNLEISLGAGTSAALADLAQKARGPSWRVAFPHYRGGDGDPKKGDIEGIALFKAHSAMARKSINDILNSDSDEQPPSSIRWIINQIQKEVESARGHGSQINFGSGSAQSGYADMVRTAGRLRAGSGS